MINTLTSQEVKPSRTEQVVVELAAVEAALRKIVPVQLEEKFLGQIPQWFLLLGLFADIEIAYSCLSDRARLEPRYRAALTSLMAWGENIWSGLEQRSDLDTTTIGYSRKLIQLNVRFLREKYDQWFFERDEVAVSSTLKLIEDARAGVA